MSAYVVIIRDKTHDPTGMEKYASVARNAPIDKLEVIAAKTGKMQVLEGPAAEAVVILRFPSMADALEWYESDAYQEALPYRKAAGEFRVFLSEGVG
ncbi:DUF1330 domain-containing protein [Luteimonas sp. BDR2-5]|uniref:DUF1330 domain-containing protein n=1 Tax=Proluteimonas luteida TaxID=2878685 RepID=UPI001E28616E|nr:DUF1330 domain-containing protein [Luteimonas sp. BDR2-5]MCD9029725.1 DUF1330 domain-containing protein [Luteimonas sp. BDR2-5]